MKLSLKIFLLIVLVAAFSLPAIGQTINVTFQANTATNLDTLNESHFVQMRGAVNGAEGEIPGSGGQSISWSSTSTLVMNNAGGDYWTLTIQMEAGDTLWYKFWTGFDADNGTIPDGGWEGAFTPADPIVIDTRTFVSGTNDTIVPVQYYHPGGGSPIVPQMWRPFEEKPDSVAIYFRVNMAGWEQLNPFDPDSLVGVRSGPPLGNVGWSESETIFLSREVNSQLDGFFWSGTAYLPATTDTIQKYKFVYYNNGVQWESTPDREFNTTNRDTTLSWVWFSDTPYDPSVNPPVSAVLTFRVSTEAVEGLDLFDRGIGDKIYVVGPNGFNIPDDLIEMTFIPALQEWATSEPFTRVPGTDITYKYFVRWDSSRVDSLSPNYIPNLRMRGINHDTEDSGWEEPSSTGGADRHYTWTSDPQQVVGGEYGFDRHFFNSSPANSFYTTPLSITWRVNMQPATDPLTNTNPHLFNPATDSVWVQFDGSLFALSQGWTTFGQRAVLLEDPDQNMVYTGTYAVDPPGWYQMGYLLAYNGDTPGTYVTNGGGTQTGRRYYEFVWPDSLADEGGQFPTSYWPSSFNLGGVDWKQTNLTVKNPPNMTQPGVLGIDDDNPVAQRFDLKQNYPNPFNPTTTVEYVLPKTSDVKVVIYNITGQVVKTLVDDKQNTGSYKVQWNGTNDAGNRVASGIYFVRMKADNFSKVRKMTLLR